MFKIKWKRNKLLETVLDEYSVELQKSNKYSICTKGTYMSVVKALKETSLAKKLVRKITTEDLQTLFDDLSRKYSKSRLLVYSAVLKNIFRYACYPLKIIDKNPMDYVDIDSRIKEQDLFDPKCKINVITHKEFLLILDYLKVRNESYILPMQISYYAGLRLGEVCGLSWDDIDLDEQYLIVRKSLVFNKLKHRYEFTLPKRNKIRYVEIPDVLKEILIAAKNKQDKYERRYKNCYVVESSSVTESFVLETRLINVEDNDTKDIPLVCIQKDGRFINRKSLETRCIRLSKKIGLNQFHFHTLRHTYATNLLNLGATIHEVKELLGHSDIGTTMNIYIHSTRSELKNTVQRLNDIYDN